MHRVAVLILFAAAASAQETKRPIEMQALVDRARALPPEFTADVLLRLAGSARLADPHWKRELIEEAFVVGAHAPLPYRRDAQGVAADSRYALEVAHNGLEVLTLQTRAVDAILPIDPPEALALYQRIAFPELAPVPCGSPFTPDVSAYFESAARLFEHAFTPQQRQREDDIQFLKQRISQMQSPAHVVPVLKMMFAVKLTPVQRQELTAEFAVTLDHVSDSDRIYRGTESTLVSAALPEWHETPLIVPALRGYIVRQLSGPRCSDSLKLKPGQLPASAASFNKLASLLDPNAAQVKPITPQESIPRSDDGTYPNLLSWQSPRSKQVLAELQLLTHGNRNPPEDSRFSTPEERSTADWNAHYQDTLKLIEAWRADDEQSREDYRFMVAHTYSVLVSLAPNGPARENAMAKYRAFLETHYAVTENRNFWFALVNRTLESAANAQDPRERAGILDELGRSTNPIISLYAGILEARNLR